MSALISVLLLLIVMEGVSHHSPAFKIWKTGNYLLVFLCFRHFAVLEVLREDEFSPLKNGPGADKDTPATARADLMNLHYRQLLSAGGTLVDSDGRKLPLIPKLVHYHQPIWSVLSTFVGWVPGEGGGGEFHIIQF